MSVAKVNERLAQHNIGFDKITMDTLDGGRRDRWTFHRNGGSIVIEVPPMTSVESIVEQAKARL